MKLDPEKLWERYLVLQIGLRAANKKYRDPLSWDLWLSRDALAALCEEQRRAEAGECLKLVYCVTLKDADILRLGDAGAVGSGLRGDYIAEAIRARWPSPAPKQEAP